MNSFSFLSSPVGLAAAAFVCLAALRICSSMVIDFASTLDTLATDSEIGAWGARAFQGLAEMALWDRICGLVTVVVVLLVLWEYGRT